MSDIPSEEDRIEALKRTEAIFGVNRSNPWGTHDYEIFIVNINKMNLRELKSLAQKVGILGEWNERGLRDALKKGFKKDKRNYSQVRPEAPKQINIDRNDPLVKSLFNL